MYIPPIEDTPIWIWQYFAKFDESDEAQCTECSTIYQICDSNLWQLKEHLKCMHGIYGPKQGKPCWMWQDYTRLENSIIAKCRLCKNNVKNVMESLEQHLVSRHNVNTEYIHWVWKNFEILDEDVKCNFCGKIVEARTHNLASHLLDDHNMECNIAPPEMEDCEGFREDEADSYEDVKCIYCGNIIKARFSDLENHLSIYHRICHRNMTSPSLMIEFENDDDFYVREDIHEILEAYRRNIVGQLQNHHIRGTNEVPDMSLEINEYPIEE